jgi:hypothetical protein
MATKKYGEINRGGCGFFSLIRNLPSSPNINKVIKSRTMKLVLHVAPIGEIRSSYKICDSGLALDHILLHPLHVIDYQLFWMIV